MRPSVAGAGGGSMVGGSGNAPWIADATICTRSEPQLGDSYAFKSCTRQQKPRNDQVLLKTKSLTRLSVRCVIFATALLLLSGCVTTSTAIATPAITKTAVAPVFASGDIVSALTKLGSTQKAYPMANGTFVVVDRTEPLPPSVVADVIAAAAPAAALNVVPMDVSIGQEAGDKNVAAHKAGYSAMMAYAARKEAELGKKVVLVFQAKGVTEDGPVTYWLSLSTTGTTGIKAAPSAQALAEAQVYAASAGAFVIQVS